VLLPGACLLARVRLLPRVCLLALARLLGARRVPTVICLGIPVGVGGRIGPELSRRLRVPVRLRLLAVRRLSRSGLLAGIRRRGAVRVAVYGSLERILPFGRRLGGIAGPSAAAASTHGSPSCLSSFAVSAG